MRILPLSTMLIGLLAGQATAADFEFGSFTGYRFGGLLDEQVEKPHAEKVIFFRHVLVDTVRQLDHIRSSPRHEETVDVR